MSMDIRSRMFVALMLTNMADNTADAQDEGHVYVFDRRQGNDAGVKISLGGLFDFELFRDKIREAFALGNQDDYVIVTTNRFLIDSSASYEQVESGDTLYILYNVTQDLCAPVQEHIDYLPHYDTLVKSGMYEYYASAGQSPLPFALAELVDNALAATVDNAGPRNIEIKLYFGDSPSQNLICVSDNGSGMTSKDLNNWAIYRLSKFNRRQREGITEKAPRRPIVCRSLNSDISYFGVGGKQALFFIGNAARMITKTANSNDVHELTLSKKDFEKKEKMKEAIYSGYISNRMVGDSSHVLPNEKILKRIIENESNNRSFTNVIITELDPKHVSFFKQNFTILCKQLAHIYHYYLHGPIGNVTKAAGARPISPFRHIDIKVILYDKGAPPCHVSLRDIESDLQTLFIRSTASTFEFNAHIEGTGIVEGLLRYHPFLYEKESFPVNETDYFAGNSDQAMIELEEDTQLKDGRGPRGDRPIFECFWNGRLIPYTKIESMDWCYPPKKKSLVPQECYYRVSGVLFTDDSFQVSTNKLTFMDLDVRLREKSTICCKVVFGQEQRVGIARAFNEWIKNCHETFDKQIKFFGFAGIKKKADGSQKKSSNAWSVYKGIEWDGKIFKTGQLVRTSRTVPVVVGTIQNFLLLGEHDGDELFATGGEMEIIQEPQSIYGEKKTFPLVKLDRNTSISALKEFVRTEELKLPSDLVLEWPDGNELNENAKVQAGSTIGPLKVDIRNGLGESVNKIPGDRMKKLLIEIKVTWHSERNGDKTIVQHTCQHGGKSWPYWFHKMENITNLGCHTLKLKTMVSDANATNSLKSLPTLEIKFTVTEAAAAVFTVGLLETPLKIGVPFQIPLSLQDKFGNIVKPSKDLTNPQLTASGMNFTAAGTSVRGNLLVIRDVIALGSVPSSGGKDFNMKISFPSFGDQTQLIRVRLMPGPPALMEVSPEQINIENGDPFKFNVEIKDVAGNLTSQPRLNVFCKTFGAGNMQSITCDCSSTGNGSLVSQPIQIKQPKAEQKLIAKIDLQHHKDVPLVERTITVVPSSKAAKFELFYLPSGSEQKKKIQYNQELQCSAGEVITGLSFALYDEGNRALKFENLTPSKVKVNWAARVNKDDVKQGKLPDLKAPVSVDDIKFCQVTYMMAGNSVEFAFNLRPSHSDPTNMKCSCADTNLRLNEALASEIKIMVYDDHGNFVKMGTADLPGLAVKGEGLKEDNISKKVANGFFVISNIEFEKGIPGPREICITWNKIKTYQRLQLLAGPATDVVLVDFDNTEPVQILNGNLFPTPIRMQLVDAAGNAAKENNIRCLLTRDAGLKLTPPPPQQRTNEQGQATFKQFNINAPRGLYQMIPKAVLSSKTAEGPIILISVEPDRNKPVELTVKFDDGENLVVGNPFPVVQASILAEDENPIMNVKKKNIVMKLWMTTCGKSNERPPANSLKFTPSKSLLNDPEGHFFFRDIVCPGRSGTYSFLIQYMIGNEVKLSSKKVTVEIKSGNPVKLVPLSVPATPTVSNTNANASRRLVENLQLELQDEFGNRTGHEISGFLYAYIRVNGVHETPLFQNGKADVSFKFLHGTVTIDCLMIQSGARGADGQEYVLVFELKPNDTALQNIEPFTLSFLFYDDVAKQIKMNELTKQRDQIMESIRTYKSLFDTTKQLVDEMKEAVQEAAAQEQKVRNHLGARRLTQAHLLTTEHIAAEVTFLKNCKTKMENEPRRQCKLPLGPRDKDILGKVAHLAQIHDDSVARVLSWHMAGDMDCVITLNTEQAKKVYRETNGRQQVLPLDSIYRKNLPDWRKPLPHERISTFRVKGNPVYARDLLVFPANGDQCRIVFGMLLGDTIIINDLDSANDYRQQVVKHAYCPTILTRAGDRIRNNGKFGGLQNRAPPLDRMQGVVFSSPLPPSYHELIEHIDLLASLETAVSRHNEAKTELRFQTERCHSQKMKNDFRDCLEAEKQLQFIDQQLGLTPSKSWSHQSLEDFMNSNNAVNRNSERRNANKRAARQDAGSVETPLKRGRKSMQNSGNFNGIETQRKR